MRIHRAALLLTMIVPSCGGRFEPYGSFDASTTTCSVAGVHLCGGTCGTPTCPGGCVPLTNGDGATASFGVCFADLADRGQTPCAVCDTGEGCVERSPGAYACVPLEICAALRALGAGDVCWYADKSPYDGKPIDVPTSCPDSTPPVHTHHAMCGGACGGCDTSLGSLGRCLGQGPEHPVGICATPYGFTIDPFDASEFPRCVASTSGTCGNENACAIFPAPPAEASVANQNGICILREDCLALAVALPGGLTCL